MQTQPHPQPRSAAVLFGLRNFSATCQSVIRSACAFAVASAMLATASFAQPAGSGTVRGKVQNASNGAYLENALVSIDGTNRQVKTNQFGEYEFRDVPAGEVSLKASYIGQPDQTVVVTAMNGVAVAQDIVFSATAETKRSADGTIVLDPYRVSAERYKNAQAIAIAEERQSITIKNVVSIDSFGDIPSGNVGEFVKFMPGVQVSYGSFGGNNQGYADNEASGISVRGFGPEDTAVLIDGLPVSNATPGSLTSRVGLDQLSINNASRIELIKVATPDMPNNSIGGQINLITKSAFEYPRPTYSGKVFFNFGSDGFSLKKTVGPVKEKTYKTTPGVEFSVSYPLSKTLGISFTGSASDQFYQATRGTPIYTTSGSLVNSAGNAVSVANPFLSRFQLTDSSSIVTHKSGNLRLDWKPTANQILRANVQYSTYDSQEAQRRLDARPTVTAPFDWDSTQTIGRVANSTLDMTVTTRDKIGNTKSAQLQYEWKHNGWRVDAKGSISVSQGDYQDRANGHFSEVGLKLNPGQVSLVGIKDGLPTGILTYSRTAPGVPVDYTSLSNYGFDGTIAKSGEALSKDTVSLYQVDVERDLSFIPFLRGNPLAFKMGARRDEKKAEKSGLGTGYQEDLIAGKSYVVSDILDTYYLNQSPGLNFPAQQWGSTYKLFELNQQNQLFAAPADGTTAVNNYNSFANQQKSLTDRKDGFYGMFTGSFFKNRLRYVGGLRQETNSRFGRGPFQDSKWNYAKNANGTLYTDNFYKVGVKYDGTNIVRTNADGSTTTITDFRTDSALISRLTAAGVKFPDHLLGPSASSLESRKLQLIPLREINTRVSGKPSYTFGTTFQLTKKIDLKASWSRSFGLPPLESGVGGLLSGNGAFVINENIPEAADGTKGTISVTNPNIKPQTADNLDFEVSYYTDTGGKLSLSYYTKSVTDQIVTFSSFSGTPEFDAILPLLDLNPADYANWRLSTSSNSKNVQKTSGYELFVSQDFGFLGRFGKPFSVFASVAIKTLADPAVVDPVVLTSPNGTAIPITPTVSTITLTANKFGGAGIQYSGRKFTAQIRGTYRNENEIARSTLPSVNGTPNFLRRFEPAETRIDVNVSYILNKRYSLFLSGRDVFNGERSQTQKDDLGLLPAYAQTFDYREFGVVWTVGLSGKF